MAGNTEFILDQYDIVISKHFQNVKVIGQTNPVIRWYAVELKYPAPLNQYLVADNALIHDLMNIKNQKVNYIVFRNLDNQICHSYLNSLELIINQSDHDQYFTFQAQGIRDCYSQNCCTSIERKLEKVCPVFLQMMSNMPVAIHSPAQL